MTSYLSNDYNKIFAKWILSSLDFANCDTSINGQTIYSIIPFQVNWVPSVSHKNTLSLCAWPKGIKEKVKQLLVVTIQKFILSSMSVASSSYYCIHELVNNFCWVIKNTWRKRMGEKVIGRSSVSCSVIENIIAIKQLILMKLCLFLFIKDN